MVSSEIRDLLSLSARPDIISFAGGLPEVRALNHQKLERYIKRTLRTDAEISLQYGDSTGYYPLRTRLIDVMALEGVLADEEDIIITAGGQQALDLLAKTFIDAGDTIITEAPSYTGALNAFKAYEANIIGIPIDEDGIIVSEVEKKLSYCGGLSPKESGYCERKQPALLLLSLLRVVFLRVHSMLTWNN